MAYSPFPYSGFGSYNPVPYPQRMDSFAPAPISAPPAPQNPAPGVNGQSGYLCRPVTSRAEAEVFQIPFDGSTTYFVDTANGKIYAKTFNFNNGTAPLVTYIREEEAPTQQYVTTEIFEALRGEMDAIKSSIESLKKPKKVVKQIDEYEDE